jgi:hypothetical protein
MAEPVVAADNLSVALAQAGDAAFRARLPRSLNRHLSWSTGLGLATGRPRLGNCPREALIEVPPSLAGRGHQAVELFT